MSPQAILSAVLIRTLAPALHINKVALELNYGGLSRGTVLGSVD